MGDISRSIGGKIMKAKNKVNILINGDETWNFCMTSTGKTAGDIHDFVWDNLWLYKLDKDNYEILRSIFLSNPDYFNIEDFRGEK